MRRAWDPSGEAWQINICYRARGDKHSPRRTGAAILRVSMCALDLAGSLSSLHGIALAHPPGAPFPAPPDLRLQRLHDYLQRSPSVFSVKDWGARGDGTGDDGRVVPDGQYRLRVALRKENRSATVQKTTTVDTRAPKSEVCVGVPCSDTKNVANIVSQGDRAIKIYIKGVSPNYRTKFRLYRTDQGKPRLFKSTGMAWEDAVVAAAVYDRR